MAKPRYSLRSKLLALVLSAVVALAALELAFQLIDYDPRKVAVMGEVATTSVYRSHPRYLWTLHPDSQIDEPDHGIMNVRSNSLGLRGPEIPARGRADEIRVLCLGDSITFGLGLRDEDTWPHHLKRALSAESGRPVVVVNGGMPGWSSVQGMRLYEDLAEEGDFDFVVFWFGMNDAKPANDGIPDGLYRSDPGPRQSGVSGLLSRSRVFQLLRCAGNLVGADSARRVSESEFRAAVATLQADRDKDGPFPLFVRCPERLEDTIREFEGMVAAAREMGLTRLSGPFGLFRPYAPHLDGAPPVGRMVDSNLGPVLLFGDPAPDHINIDLADVEGFLAMLHAWKEAVDLCGDLLPEDHLSSPDVLGDLPPRTLFRDNCHLTPLGTRRAGESIAVEILRRAGN